MKKARRTQNVLVILLLLALAAFLASCGGDSDETTSAPATDTTATTTEEKGCEQVPAPKAKKVSFKAPEQVLKPGEKAIAVMKTNCGTFEIALDTQRAPKTANSFAFLIEEGFYDDLTFHRVVPGFVIQGGDPEGLGTGGPGYTVDEAPPSNLSYTKGVVAMAKSSADPPGRSGSQFYVVTGADAGLPPEYALVGKVTEGFDAVARIEKLGDAEEKPKQTVIIEEMTIERG